MTISQAEARRRAAGMVRVAQEEDGWWVYHPKGKTRASGYQEARRMARRMINDIEDDFLYKPC